MFLTPDHLDILTRLAVAVALGGLIGLEREAHGKEAGFRTYALVSLGSALIMIVSAQVYEIYQSRGADVDPSRIAAQVVSGIGFLGAGAIIRFQRGVKGITTAAGIWVSAGIGLACGLRQYFPAVVTTVFVLIVLVIFTKVDDFFAAKTKKDDHEPFEG